MVREGNKQFCPRLSDGVVASPKVRHECFARILEVLMLYK